MKKIIFIAILMAVVIAAIPLASFGQAASELEKEDALWFEAKRLAKEGKFEEALKIAEKTTFRKETILHMTAVTAADDYADYDTAIAIMDKLTEEQRKDHLALYIPLSVANKHSSIVFRSVARTIKLKMEANLSADIEKTTLIPVFNNLYRMAAAIYANRGLWADNVKVINLIARDSIFYRGAVANGAAEIMNGEHKNSALRDGYLAELGYEKIGPAGKMDYAGGERFAVAYHSNMPGSPSTMLLLYDGENEKEYITMVFLEAEKEPRPHLKNKNHNH